MSDIGRRPSESKGGHEDARELLRRHPLLILDAGSNMQREPDQVQVPSLETNTRGNGETTGNGQPRSDNREPNIDSLQSLKIKSEAVLKPEVDPNGVQGANDAKPDSTSWTTLPTNELRTTALSTTGSSSGVGPSSSSFSSPKESQSLPTSTLPTSTNSTYDSQSHPKTITSAPSPPYSGGNTATPRPHRYPTSGHTAQGSNTIQSQGPEPTDYLAKFCGDLKSRPEDHTEDYRFYEVSHGLEGFVERLEGEIKDRCATGKMKDGLKHINFYLAKPKKKGRRKGKQRVRLWLRMECVPKVNDKCKKAMRKISLSDIAETCDVLEGWKPDWKNVEIETLPLETLGMRACQRAPEVEYHACGGAPYSLFGNPLDGSRAKATVTCVTHLDGRPFILSTAHHLRKIKDTFKEKDDSSEDEDDSSEDDQDSSEDDQDSSGDDQDSSGDESISEDGGDDASEVGFDCEDIRENHPVGKSNNIITPNRDAPSSVLFYTDEIQDNHPSHLTTQKLRSQGCIFPACPYFSACTARKVFIPSLDLESQPSADSLPASNIQPLPSDCQSGLVSDNRDLTLSASFDCNQHKLVPMQHLEGRLTDVMDESLITCRTSAHAEVYKGLRVVPEPVWRYRSADYALFQIEPAHGLRAAPSFVNRVTLKCQEPKFHQVFITRVASRRGDCNDGSAEDPPIEGLAVTVKTRHGLLPALGLDNRWSDSQWRIQLTDGKFEKGDSGSPVIDLRTGCLYGFLTQAVLDLRIGYIVPAADVEKDAPQTCKIMYNENSKWFPGKPPQPDPPFTDLPSTTETISVLPHKFQLLGHESDILVATMREGQVRDFRKLFDAVVKRKEDSRDDKEWLKTLRLLLRETIESDKGEIVSHVLKNSKLDINALDDLEQSPFEQLPLHHAASLGRYDICRRLITHGARVDVPNSGDSTSLLLAIKWRHPEVAELLISEDHNKCTLSRADGRGETPLGMAAFRGLSSVIECLLQNGRVHIDSEQYRRVLRNIVISDGSHGQIQSVKSVNVPVSSSIDECADRSENKLKCFAVLWASPQVKDLLAQSDEMYDALQEATMLREEQCFYALLERIKKQDSKRHRQVLNICLVNACKSHSLSIVESLLKCDVDPLYKAEGISAIRAAVESGLCPLIRLLLEHMAKTDRTVDRQTAVSWAARKGHAEAIGLLENHVVCTDSPGILYRESPLHAAASNGHREAILTLIKIHDCGTVDSKDFLGRTPLMLAAEKGHVEVIQLLHQAGANLSQTDGAGRTAIELAAVRGRASVVYWLLETDSPSEVSDRCLCAAARSVDCSSDIMEALLLHGTPKDPLAVLRNSLQGHPATGSLLLVNASLQFHDLHPATAAQLIPRLTYEAFVRLYEQCDRGRITREAFLVAAMKNTQDATKIVEKLLLPHYTDVTWSDDSLICAASSNDVFGSELVVLILKSFPQTKITVKALETAAGNARWSSRILEDLLKHHSLGPIDLTSRLLREVERNSQQRSRAPMVLLNARDVEFGHLQVIEAVQTFDFEFIELLLERHSHSDNDTLFSEMFAGHPARLEALFEAAIENKLDGKDFECDGNISLELIQFLLNKTSEAHVEIRCTIHMMDLLANNSSNRWQSSSRIIEQLLTHKCVTFSSADHCWQAIFVTIAGAFGRKTLRLATEKAEKAGCRLNLNASLLSAAATNAKSAKDLVQYLLEASRSDLDERNNSRELVTEAVICAAARNVEARALIGLLADDIREEILTPSFWGAVCSNMTQAVLIVELLLEKMPRPCVEIGVVHMIENYWAIGHELLKSVPTLLREPKVTRELALIAAGHMQVSVLTGILDRSPNVVPVDELLKAACKNWKNGFHVVTLLLGRWPIDLAGHQVPKMVMLAAVENWMSAEEILKAFKRHKMIFTVTEKVLVAALQNPITSVEVARLLLHEVDMSTLVTPQILMQAAANISHPLELLKILLPESCEHLLTESVLEAAAGNGAASIELLMFLHSRTKPQAITSKVILAAAKNNQTGRMGLVLPMHAVPYGLTASASPMFKNRNRLFRRSSDLDSGCSFFFTAGSAYDDRTPREVELLWGSVKRAPKPKSLKIRLQRQWAWRDGFSFFQYLFVQAPSVDVGSIVEQAAEFTTCAMMRLLLDHTKSVTTETLRRAAKNELHGAEITEMLLLQYPNLEISIDTLVTALENIHKGSDIIEILCSYPQVPPVKHNFLNAAAGTLYMDERRYQRIAGDVDVDSREILKWSDLNEQNGYDLWSGLIKTSPSDVDEDFVAFAVRNPVFAPRFVQVILCCGRYTKVSPTVLTAAAANSIFAPQLLARLLQLWREELSASIPDILASAAANEGTGPEALSYLLNFFGENCRAHIDFSVLQAAMKNRMHGSIITETLLAIQNLSWTLDEHFRGLISAAVENESQGDTIMKKLMQKVPSSNGAQCDGSIFTAAARNTASGHSLMASLVEYFQTTTVPLSTWTEACRNTFDGPRLVTSMLQRTADRSFIGKELFLAAATNESGGLEILRLLLSNTSTLVFTEFLANINQYCAVSSITDDIIAMVSQIDEEIPCIRLNISTLAKLEADTVQHLSRKARVFMISDARSQKVSFFDPEQSSNPVGIPVQKAILKDEKICLTRPVVEHFARFGDAEVFALLVKCRDINDLLSAVSQNQIYGGQIFNSYINSKVLLDDPSPLSYAIRHKDWTLLESLASGASQATISEVILNAATDVEVLKFLLKKDVEFDITEELLIAACPVAACLQILLQHDGNRKPEITESIMLAAVKRATTPDSLLLLTEYLREPPITEALLITAIEKVEALGYEAFARLIGSMKPMHLSSAVVTKAASKGGVLELLVWKFETIPLYHQALESAAEHHERLQLLWDCKQETLTSSDTVSAAAANKNLWDFIERQKAANGEPPVEITEGMLKYSMQDLEQLRNLLKRYTSRVCSQSLLFEASSIGGDVLEVIQQHFPCSTLSQQTIKLVKERATPKAFAKIIGVSPPSSLVHALLESLVWFPFGEDDEKVAILISRVKAILPARILPSTFLYPPALFRDIVAANKDKFVAQVLEEGLTNFSATPSIFEEAVIKQFSPSNTRRFSQNFITLIERHKHLVTEELLVHSLLCEATPFEVIHTIVRICRPPLERLPYVAEVAGQAGNNSQATLRLLLGMLNMTGTGQTSEPAKQTIERLLIGDRRLVFSQPQKLYATAKTVNADVEAKQPRTRASKGEEPEDEPFPSDDEDHAYNSKRSLNLKDSDFASVGRKSSEDS